MLKVNPRDGLYIPTRYPHGVPDSIPAEEFTRPATLSALAITDIVLEKVPSVVRIPTITSFTEEKINL